MGPNRGNRLGPFLCGDKSITHIRNLFNMTLCLYFRILLMCLLLFVNDLHVSPLYEGKKY